MKQNYSSPSPVLKLFRCLVSKIDALDEAMLREDMPPLRHGYSVMAAIWLWDFDPCDRPESVESYGRSPDFKAQGYDPMPSKLTEELKNLFACVEFIGTAIDNKVKVESSEKQRKELRRMLKDLLEDV